MADPIVSQAAATVAPASSTAAAPAAPTPAVKVTPAGVNSIGEPPVMGRLVSRLEHPVFVDYNGERVKVSARRVSGLLDKRLLGSVPMGVTFVPA